MRFSLSLPNQMTDLDRRLLVLLVCRFLPSLTLIKPRRLDELPPTSTIVSGRLHRERRTLLPRGTYPMPNDTAERWRALCDRAAKERDSEKLLELATEIDRLLEAQELSLRHPEDLAAAA
jgi:hypothetical protein